MKNKFILLLFIFAVKVSGIYSQNYPKIYLSGVKGYTIKISQLADTAIKITTNYNDKFVGYATVYFSGAGFQSVVSTTMFLEHPLRFTIGIEKKLTAGASITIDGGHFFTDSAKTKKVYFEGSSYEIIE